MTMAISLLRLIPQQPQQRVMIPSLSQYHRRIHQTNSSTGPFLSQCIRSTCISSLSPPNPRRPFSSTTAYSDKTPSNKQPQQRQQQPSTTSGPLQGLRILDFTRILAGPFCTQILSDYGASVIKVENPQKGDETRSWRRGGLEGSIWKTTTPAQNTATTSTKSKIEKENKASEEPISIFFSSLNRGKKSLAIDLKTPEAKSIIHRLVSTGEVDIIIENFVPGTMDRLGIGYTDLSALNPGVIFASISGYGNSGPHGHRAGYDAIANAEGGMMNITGSMDSGPVRAGVGLTDMATGLFIHGAVLAAVIHRMKTQRGQWISGSLFETTLAMMTSVGAQWLNLQVETNRFGAGHPSVVPYNAWKCSDGIWMVVAANSDKQFGAFCRKLRKDEWVDDERFVSNAKRVENRLLLDRSIQEVFLTKSHLEWLDILDGSGLAHGPVNTVQKAFEHPQTKAREMVQEVEWDALSGEDEHGRCRMWKAIGVPVKFGETPGKIQGPPSRLGEHSEEVLAHVGYTTEEIEQMREKGVFGR